VKCRYLRGASAIEIFRQRPSSLAALGTARYLGADPGLAALHDLALPSAIYGMLGGFLHAATLVGTEGIKAGELMPLLEPWLRAMLPSLDTAAEQIDSGNCGDHVTSPLGMQAATFGNFIDPARKQGIKPDLLLGLRTLMDKAAAAGHGEHDIASLGRGDQVLTRHFWAVPQTPRSCTEYDGGRASAGSAPTGRSGWTPATPRTSPRFFLNSVLLRANGQMWGKSQVIWRAALTESATAGRG